MKLKDSGVLVAHMNHKDFTQARLARAAGVSRQFIHMLTHGEKDTCSETTGARIEEALDVPEGTLFLRSRSPKKRLKVARETRAA